MINKQIKNLITIGIKEIQSKTGKNTDNNNYDWLVYYISKGINEILIIYEVLTIILFTFHLQRVTLLQDNQSINQ